MRHQDNVLTVLNLLYDDEIEPQYCSPNFVANYAYERSIALCADEVVMISDYYGENHCPTGRNTEVEDL